MGANKIGCVLKAAVFYLAWYCTQWYSEM